MTDHDRGRDQRAQAPPRQPNDRHKQNGEGNPRHHAEHPLHSVHECARQGCLHDQQSGERGDQRWRFTQTNQLSHHEGRHRRSRHPRSPGQRGPPAGAHPPASPDGRRAGDSPQPAPDTVYAHSQRSPPLRSQRSPPVPQAPAARPDDSTLEANTRNRCCTNRFHAPTGRMQGMFIRRVAPLRVWVDYVGGGGLGDVGAVAAGELPRRNRERPPHAVRPAVGTDHVPVRARGGVTAPACGQRRRCARWSNVPSSPS